jgi:hypothetical protein
VDHTERREEYGRDSHGSGYRPVAGFLEHGNEPFVSIEYREYLERLRIRLHAVSWLSPARTTAADTANNANAQMLVDVLLAIMRIRSW